MRIFLLPISTRRALIYCQRLTEKPPAELSYIDWITNRASTTWAKWESAEKGWQKRLTEYGNKALQRIAYQEWALKSFPPLNAHVQAEELSENKKFQVHYPGNIIKQDDVPKIMSRLARERKQLHWSRFVGSMIGIPLSIPFVLVPVIPNLPFFYLSFRCWSHWRALKGSDHLDFIIDHRLFKPISSPQMEAMYSKIAPKLQNSFTFVTRSQVLEGRDPEEQMLLTAASHEIVARSLRVPELGNEVERAVRQVEKSLVSAQKVGEEKQHATTPDDQRERKRK